MVSIRSYIFYAFLLFGVLIVMSYIDYRLEHFAKESFRVWKWIILKPLLYIPVGAGKRQTQPTYFNELAREIIFLKDTK